MNKLFLDENLTVDDVTLADVKMQKIYLERDRVYMIAQSATNCFFLFLIVGLVGLLKNYFSMSQFFMLLFMSIIILLISSYPYMKSLLDEKYFLDYLESQLKMKKKEVRIKKRHLK